MTPTEIKYKGKVISAPKDIAENYAEFFETKIENMRKSIEFNNFKAMNVFRKKIKWIEEDAEFKPIEIKEMSKILKNLKTLMLKAIQR